MDIIRKILYGTKMCRLVVPFCSICAPTQQIPFLACNYATQRYNITHTLYTGFTSLYSFVDAVAACKIACVHFFVGIDAAARSLRHQTIKFANHRRINIAHPFERR